MEYTEINKINNTIISFLNSLDINQTNRISTKIKNVCGKTGRYTVPPELYQKRTARKNRVQIPWKSVKKNNLTMSELETFYSGIVVDFVNDDFFNNENKNDPLFKELLSKLGSDNVVSSMISFKSENGTSSSSLSKLYFTKFINNSEFLYNDKNIIINENNWKDYIIKKTSSGSQGNDKFSGFLYVNIRGGQQNVIYSHEKDELLFNPAVEYANEKVSSHINSVLLYFTMLSVNKNILNLQQLQKYKQLFIQLETILNNTYYDNELFTGNLLQYVQQHPSVQLFPDELTDPIQIKKINIEDFTSFPKTDNYLHLSHDHAVIFEKYYFDKKQQCILSAANPVNLSWSFELSNMMQQNYTLDEYFTLEQERVERRKKIIKQPI